MQRISASISIGVFLYSFGTDDLESVVAQPAYPESVRAPRASGSGSHCERWKARAAGEGEEA